MDASDVVPDKSGPNYCTFVDYWHLDAKLARMGGMKYLWVRCTMMNGEIPIIGNFNDLYDEASIKRQKVSVQRTFVINWNTRHACLQGDNMCPMHQKRHACKLGNYFKLPDDSKIIDYNEVAIASMIAVHGDNVAMAKLIIMQAVQSCYVNRDIDWGGIGPRITMFANAILGGYWSGGVHGWSFDCLQMSEIYVAYIEDKAIWMGRSPGASVICFDENGDCVGL